MLTPKYFAVIGAAVIGPIVTTAELAHGKEQDQHCHPEHQNVMFVQKSSAIGSSMTTAAYAIGLTGTAFKIE